MGSALPLASTGFLAEGDARSVARWVVSSTRIPFTGAADCSRARGVHHVARRHALARVRPRVERDECLAGGDPDPHLELALLLGPVADRERRADRALGVVLVGQRRAESAMTASPMNFSTVPPKRSSSERSRSW